MDFPEITSALLANLNQQRVEGKLCDISIHVQGRVFRAHRAVLAASSPYFHDQVLLKNMTSIVLPNVMDPSAFGAGLGLHGAAVHGAGGDRQLPDGGERPADVAHRG